MNDLEQRIVTWASTQAPIRAIIVVGSKARRDHPADAWADLDLMLFCTDFIPYLSDTIWLSNLGTLWLCLSFQQPDEEPQRLAVFEGGQKLDCHFFPVSDLEHMVTAHQLDDTYQRGYYTLLDKDDLCTRLPPPTYTFPIYDKPSPADFSQMITRFWYEALQTAKTIRRRDLWVVKGWDFGLKTTLRQFIEWHARVHHGWDYDTWHVGRFMLDWTDAATRQSLNGLFAHFDPADSWQALLATIALFQRLASETASLLGYPYPADLAANITALIHQLRVEDTDAP